jgi:hypothetical protein
MTKSLARKNSASNFLGGGPSVGYLLPNLTKQLRQSLGLGNDRKEIRVVTPPGNNVLVQVSCDSSAGNLTLIHAYVEAVVAGTFLKRRHGLLRQQSNFCYLCSRGLVVCVDVSVRANQEVSRVVRKEVEKHERTLTALHNQRLFVRERWCETKRALIVSWLLRALNVDKAVRRPKSLKRVGNGCKVCRLLKVLSH